MKLPLPGRRRLHLATVLHWACRSTASPWLTMGLLGVLAATLAWSRFLEAAQGRELAPWRVYSSPWFCLLLGLVGANILAATVRRFPWRRRQLGLVVAQGGLLVLLAGALQTSWLGVAGQVVLSKGERADRILLPDRSVVTIKRTIGTARKVSDFTFAPGPVDWPGHQSLDFGQADGLGLKVLKFIRHAQPQVTWVASRCGPSDAAVQLELLSRGGHTVAENWLTATAFGGQAVVGPTLYQLLPVDRDTQVEDFTHPPQDLGTDGVLSIHYEGRLLRIGVAANLGRRIPLPGSQLAVEIVQSIPDGRPTPSGQFVSRSQTPRNPLLELRVYEPGRPTPTRQVAFAKSPLLNLDAIQGRTCPVKFWYHRVPLSTTPGAVFLQAPDGALYCRAVVHGQLGAVQRLSQGGQFSLGGQFTVRIRQHLPFAHQEVSFQPVATDDPTGHRAEAAALVEVQTGNRRQQLWLSRGDREYGARNMLAGTDPLVLSFDYARVPLGFTIQLQDIQRGPNPGDQRSAAVSSTVRLFDPHTGTETLREIAVDAPVTQSSYRLYQSRFRKLPAGIEASVLTAVHDPGRRFKFLGSLLVCGGLGIMFVTRTSPFGNVPSQWINHSAVRAPAAIDSSATP